LNAEPAVNPLAKGILTTLLESEQLTLLNDGAVPEALIAPAPESRLNVEGKVILIKPPDGISLAIVPEIFTVGLAPAVKSFVNIIFAPVIAPAAMVSVPAIPVAWSKIPPLEFTVVIVHVPGSPVT